MDNLPLKYKFQEASEKTERALSPLLIVLHGRGDSPDGFAWMPKALAIPRLNYLFLQAPDSYYGGFSWYDLPPKQLPGILRSRALLKESLEKIIAEGFSAQNIFLFGFSQGCLMTLEFGARFPSKLGGYIGISGYVYDPELLKVEANEEVIGGNWLITHGTEDEVLPVERTRAQIEFLKRSGFRIDYQEYRKGHTIDEKLELPFLRKWIADKLNS